METIIQKGDVLKGTNVIHNEKWMGDLEDKIGNWPLTKVVIPGTHDSGTYGIKGNAPASKTQYITIFEQLSLGARFLDLRIYRYKEGGPYKLFHGMRESSVSLDVALNDVRRFIDNGQHSKEIIIIGITPANKGKSDMNNILNILLTKFSNKIASKNFTREHSIKDLWDKEKQIILFWNWNSSDNNYPRKIVDGKEMIDDEFLWTYKDVKYAYAGLHSSPSDFIEPLTNSIKSNAKENEPFIIQGVVPFYFFGSWNIHKDVKTVHTKFRHLIENLWNTDKGKYLNIIIVDFFNECTDFITELIRYNEQMQEIKSKEVKEKNFSS